MIINPRILRRDLVQLLSAIDDQIKEVEERAEELNIPPTKMRDASGNWVMIPLLAAKVQGLSALAQLNDTKEARG